MDEIVKFYKEELGMTIWLEQVDCTVLRKGNLLLGFCQRDSKETEGMITIFFDTKEEVDHIYNKLEMISEFPPKENPRYKIYQFFAKDPEGRVLEFQAFLHPVEPVV